MTAFPSSFSFLCGAHFDQILRIEGEVQMGSSNPSQLETYPGGAALNSASIAAALGLDCAIISPVGADAAARALKETCVKRGIDQLLMETQSHPTGLYSAILTKNGDVIIGASDLRIYDVIDLDWIKNHLQPCEGLFITSNLDPKSIELALSKAKIVAAATISPAKAMRLKNSLSRIDLLFTNLKEARVLSGQSDGGSIAQANWLMEKGVKFGTVSDGENPLIGYENGSVFEFESHIVNNRLDVNGAGDALAGGVLAALGNGANFKDAVRFGNAVAAHSIGFKGPYPTQIDLEIIQDRYFQ